MQNPRPLTRQPDGTPAELPPPNRASRWRWSRSRRALVGGGVLAAVLSLGSVAAGAATPGTTKPPAGAHNGGPPPGMAKPTAAGKITALSGDDITVQDQNKTTETIVFSSSTTFRTMSGTTTSAALKVGDFISATGTKNSDGTVTATAVMIGGPPPGGGPGGHPGGKPPAGHNPGGPPKGSNASG